MEKRQISSEFKIDSRTVEGYGTIFDTTYPYGGYYETIHNGAITNDTIINSDVLAKFNHSDDKVLARSNKGQGSLLLEVDETGLRYMFESPNTALGDELLEYLHRGDINSSSFAFTVAVEEGAERWSKKDGKIYRDIYKIGALYDVSPVFQPANPSAICSKRYNEVKATSDEIDKIMDLYKEEIDLL